MSARWILLLSIMLGNVGSGLTAEPNFKTGTVPKAKEAFAENAALKEQGFKEAYYNAKQQHLRDHYLEVPIGPLPKARRQEAAPLPPPETPQPRLDEEAGLGVSIVQNRPLNDTETNNATSTVGEPSLAVRGQEILFTGNWFASFSKNGGQSFQYRNPDTTFPSIPSRPFCCDQVALYVPSHDLMVWFLQYSKNSTGNTVRVAVAHGVDIAAERWRYYDFTPQGVGNWTGEWFDYPDLGVSDGSLFITTNCFNMSSQFQRSVALRLSLDQLKNYAALDYQYFDRSDVGSLRLAQGQGNTMYIGSHLNLGALRVFAWTDGNNNYQNKDFTIQSWVRGGATSPGPDGRDWLGYVDGRITAAWNSGNRQGFGWTSAQGGSFSKPHVRVAIINWAAGTVVSQPHVWNGSIAFAYPAAGVNAANRVGVTMCYNSSSLAPSHAVGVLNTDNSWALAGTVNGSNGPITNRWGDYLTVRANGQNRNRFACVGFTLSGGPNQGNIVQRLVQFDMTVMPSPQPESAPMPPTIPPQLMPSQGETQLSMSDSQRAAQLKRIVQAAVAKEKGTKFSKSGKQPQSVAMELMSSNAAPDDGQSNKAVVRVGKPKDVKLYAEQSNLPPAYRFFYPTPESVCWPDDRLQVLETSQSPWNGNCQLIITFQDDSQAIGTGWFAGPRTVITAGHCVHEGEGGNFFKSVEVIPGMNGMVRPFGSITSTNLRASEGWKTSGLPSADYGAILLDNPFPAANGMTPGLFPSIVASDETLNGMNLMISGYPADKPFGTQWRDAGVVQTVLPTRLAYSIDTFGGHSGSVVTGTVNGQIVAVGIHNYGGCPNRCTRITSSVKADLDQWTAESNAENKQN